MAGIITFDDLHAAISLEDFDAEQAHLRMAPLPRRMRPLPDANPRQAGVLVLLYPEADGLHVVLTRRTEQLRGHSGQISFPGGQRDPQDASFTVTALREACEEVGVCEDSIMDIVGHLTSIYIPPSNFQVFPTVGALAARPVFKPNPDEVAEVFSLALHHLLDPRHKRQEDRNIQGFDVRVPFYQAGAHKVWGATAVILSELEGRLRAVLPPAALG